MDKHLSHPPTVRNDSSLEGFRNWRILWPHFTRIAGRRFISRLIIIQCPWFAVLLTRIGGPDSARDPHNHARTFWTYILFGSYTERRWHTAHMAGFSEVVEHPRGSFRKLGSWEAHSITRISRIPLITLVFAGKHNNEGFYFYPIDGGKPVHYLEYG